jgi:glycosyltransferase involved in cell wall biosynthesis
MRIVQIVPGSGGSFYCQNCLRDNSLVTALRALGEAVTLVPMYLPMLADQQGPGSTAPVFYGAVNLYLQQRFPWLRRVPRGLAKLLDSPALLRCAARKAGSTRARGLAEMTLSMLRGEDGQQSAELERLVSWLAAEEKPDVVHLSNALLLGLARRIKRELKVPLVCGLQDEDSWIDAMEPGAARSAWQMLAEKAKDVDAFVTVSHYYARVIHQRMQVPLERIQVIPMGIELDGYEAVPLTFDPPVVGYLSRMAESLGLGLLMDAFIQLKSDARFKALRLRVTGGQTGDDTEFLARLRRRLEREQLLGDVDFVEAFDRPSRRAFLQSLSVLSVPVPQGEAFGMYQLEAMACGVPVVQPNVGAFPEVIEATGGGIVYDPKDARGLADGLASLLLNREWALQLGQKGRQAVFKHFGVGRMAQDTLGVYRGVGSRLS